MAKTITNHRVTPQEEKNSQDVPVQFHEKPVKTTFDVLLEQHLGQFGRYQLLQMIILTVPDIFVAMHVMSWTFVAAPTTVTIGRKKVFYLAIIIEIFCGLMMTVVPTWWLFAILKGGTGLAHPGIFSVGLVLATEFLGTRYRKLGSITEGVFYAIGEILLAGLAYAITDYRLLQAAIALPSLVFISYWWLVPESARWLVTKERYEEADVILKKAARINGTCVPERWWDKLQSVQNNKQQALSVIDLVRTPNMRKRTLVCCYKWLVITMVFYGLTMKSDLFGGSLHLNFAISALVEIPALFLIYVLIDRIGRRQIVAGGLLIAGLSLIASWIVGDDVHFYWRIMQMMIAKGAVSVSIDSMYTYTFELFPTVIRNTAVGCCSMAARIGAVSSSYIVLWLVDSYGELAMVVPFTIFSITAALSILVFLPETMNKDLPESISEVESTKF
ncbi:hypothetical protein KIN20_023683 [Parelaphostrongylus tenuis]|uniref:Major facilitator superfamily (MFS) profile domain-containing protein n=1 Tax=Parelaphostrongylus tenuis TaxID=148309 RepID=A0AAD5MXA8_PARTN|nr:hypothetical protein KIN20_023683 [Parelaphostrongylus tenuis]